MNSESSLKIKFITSINLVFFLAATLAHADPVVAGEILPPASATLVADPDLVRQIAVGPEDEPVWCYSNDANAIIVSAPQRERERCKLEYSQKINILNATHTLEMKTLNIQLESLTKKHEDIVAIKNKEIEDLTAAALKRPNDYSLWWASGGVAVGVLTTLAIVFAVK